MSWTGLKKNYPLDDESKKKLVDPTNEKISVVRQCELLDLNRATYYYESKPVSEWELFVTQTIDEIYTEFPIYGSPRITAELKRRGFAINHKAVERLMRKMGVMAIYPKKNLSKANIEHLKYPYLLKDLEIIRPNQVWGTDITYIKANRTWFYLVAVLDWFSRFVITWRLSPSLTADFCAENLNNALELAQPEIHNSDQGCQFTSEEYISVLKKFPDIKISMDGRGRCFDNIFTERLWRTVKYDEVYLHDYQSYQEAESQLNLFFEKYNYRRLHQSLKYQTPAEVYFNQPFNQRSIPSKN